VDGAFAARVGTPYAGGDHPSRAGRRPGERGVRTGVYQIWKRTAGVARRSGAGSPARLLHPAALRARAVRGSAARFRAWRGAPGQPHACAPAGTAVRTAVPAGRGFDVGLRGPRPSDRTRPVFGPHL